MDPTLSAPRILYAITQGTWGGAQRYVYELATAAKAQGYEVAVAYGVEGVLVEKLAEAGIRTVPLPHVERDVAMFGTDTNALHAKTILGSVMQEYRVLQKFIALIKEERPDVLHVNSSKIGGVGALAGRIAGVKRIVFTAHGWAFNERRPWWQVGMFRFLYALVLWLSHETICVSEAVRRDMAWLPFSNLKVVLHGLDAPSFQTKETARTTLLPQKKDALWLGMIAELHPTKRVEDAIDALAELSISQPKAILVVLGEGAYRNTLEERIRHYDFSDRVFLLGFVKDASSYLPAFDLFLMPSRTEALGLALVEAGYAGLPVVATRVGGMPEVVRHKESGLLVPRENPHALARAIRTLIEHPDDAKKYGEALQKRVKEKFSKERMLKETFAVYKN